MSSSQELLHTKVADLRQLLQKSSNEDKVGPLVTALLAGKVDSHARMLADLANTLKKWEEIIGNKPEHRIYVAERIDKIEQDVLGLQQLIQSSPQKDIATKADVHRLGARLTEASELSHSKTHDFEECLQLIRARIEGLTRAANEVAEFKRATENTIASVLRDVHKWKGAVEKVTSDTPILKRVVGNVNRAMELLDQTSDGAGNVRLSLTAIGYQQDTHNNLARGRLAESELERSGIHSDPPHNSSASQSHLKTQNPNPRDRSAVTDFIATYESWKSVYKSRKPNSDAGFIEKFLKTLNLHSL
ncbi:hypothetical protein F4678DRAFT_486221 [Xylaria arbuscula]|nr:hypothetical protein F4678DRAFT_486221 [Xylaria arbuscula]